MSAISIALSTLSLLGEPRATAGAVIRSEAAAGLAPVAPGERAERSVALTLDATPNIMLETPRSTLRMDVGVRLYARQPNLGGIDRPLVLGHAAFQHNYALDRRTAWATNATGSAGEVDYSNAQLALAPGTGAQLTVPVLTSMRVQVASGVDYAVSKTHSALVRAAVEHSESIGSQVGTLPTSTAVGADARWRWFFDSRTSLSIPLQVRYYFVDPTPDSLATSMGLVVTRQLQRDSTLELGAGLTRVDIFVRGESTYPRATLAWRQVISRHENVVVRNDLLGGIDAVFDTTRARVLPVASLQMTTLSSWRRDWAMRFTVASYAQFGPVQPPEVAGTTVSAEAGVDRRLGDAWDLLAGVRYLAHASDLRAEHLRIIDRQGWVFVGLSANLETRLHRRDAFTF